MNWAGWAGHVKLSAPMGPRVRLGNLMVPRSVVVQLSGEDGFPDANYEFEMSPIGEARCVKVEVLAKPTGRGISTADMSLIAVDQLIDNAFMELAQEIVSEGDGNLHTAYSGGVAGTEAAPIRRARDRGKAAMREELATVAHVYASGGHAPVVAVTERFGYPRRTAARRIQRAREEGFLPASGEPITDDHLRAIQEALTPDEGRLDSFESPAEFDAWYAEQFKDKDNG